MGGDGSGDEVSGFSVLIEIPAVEVGVDVVDVVGENCAEGTSVASSSASTAGDELVSVVVVVLDGVTCETSVCSPAMDDVSDPSVCFVAESGSVDGADVVVEIVTEAGDVCALGAESCDWDDASDKVSGTGVVVGGNAELGSDASGGNVGADARTSDGAVM